MLETSSKHNQNQKESKQVRSMKLLQVQYQLLNKVTRKPCKTISKSCFQKMRMILTLLHLKHRQRFQKVLTQNLMLSMSHKRLKTVTNRPKNRLMKIMLKLSLQLKFQSLKVQLSNQLKKNPIFNLHNQKCSNNCFQKQLIRKETLSS